MKKIGIVTIIDDNNYGNRLQNYAVQQFLIKRNLRPITLKNSHMLNNYDTSKLNYTIKKIKVFYKEVKKQLKNISNIRYNKFKGFNKYITFNYRNIDLYDDKLKKRYDYFIVGSDQVWNPTFGWLNDVSLLKFAEDNQKVSISASFGVSDVNDIERLKCLESFKSISVRENAGLNIIKEQIGRNDAEVLLDPTMLINVDEWKKVEKKPEILKCDKYILNYFLGELSQERKKEIDRIAKENNCEVINILDKNSPFYQTGPSEFLYLEKNAFLICTDSFHSCVFAILYNRPFVVFNREDKVQSMNSRLETLLSKFNLEERYLRKNIINNTLLEHDYENAYKILEIERQKANDFLERAIN